jgi:acyl-coenzyme A synthetase/AMP-(fatty) acid ligase
VATSYGQLLAVLNRAPVHIKALYKPRDTAGALEEIALAIAHEADLTLLDADFGDGEIAALGFDKSQINQSRPIEGALRVDQELLQKRAGGASRARLGLFTSGSTGLPKLVWQSVANLARAVKVSPRRAEAVWALAYNPTHIAGIQVYLQALANGCTVVDVYGLDRTATLAALERYGVTHLSGTPSFYRLLLPVDRPISTVKSVTLGGESSDSRLLVKVQELFPNARIHNVYASTEAGTLLVAEGDTFAIAPGLENKVVLRDGKLTVHRSLLGDFAGGAVAGDWYDTGDVVEIVSEQPLRFRIVARERDWVNVGGSKVNPHEVESALGEHPAVKQVRVFGRKNSVMGHILCAEVVLRKADDGQQTTEIGLVTEPALREFAATRLQAFKVPRMIRFVDNLATTRTGKLSRT